MDKRPIVLVDMDGVLANFEFEAMRRVNAVYPEARLPEPRKFRVHHNFDDPQIRQIITEAIRSQGFYRSLPLIDGAREAWQHMIQLGYHPRICSSPLVDNPWCESEKRDWLREHFGEDVANDAIIDRHKYRHQGIALIDDRLDLKHVDRAPWQQILFDQPYNREAATDLRLMGWRDPNLESLLAQCRDQSRQRAA